MYQVKYIRITRAVSRHTGWPLFQILTYFPFPRVGYNFWKFICYAFPSRFLQVSYRYTSTHQRKKMGAGLQRFKISYRKFWYFTHSTLNILIPYPLNSSLRTITLYLVLVCKAHKQILGIKRLRIQEIEVLANSMRSTCRLIKEIMNWGQLK